MGDKKVNEFPLMPAEDVLKMLMQAIAKSVNGYVDHAHEMKAENIAPMVALSIMSILDGGIEGLNGAESGIAFHLSTDYEFGDDDYAIFKTPSVGNGVVINKDCGLQDALLKAFQEAREANKV